jgi:glutaredoxin 2
MSELLSELEKLNRELIRSDSYSIQNIENPSEDIQLFATSRNGFSIQYIENPSEVVQLNATSEDGLSLKYIWHVS